ncbi:MAG: hypothetical protein MK005_05925 [Alcanivorax sp.]|nr:hypothetical protein [Alcanivorax sp.]
MNAQRIPILPRPLLAALMLGSLVLVGGARADQLAGTLGGEPQRWYVLSGEDGAQGTATFAVLGPGMVRYSLQGHLERTFATRGSLSLAFTVMNGQLLGAPEVSYFPSDKLFPVYSNEGAGDLTIKALDNHGNQTQLRGRYQGMLVRLEGVGQAPNGSDTLTLDIEFDVGMTSR